MIAYRSHSVAIVIGMVVLAACGNTAPSSSDDQPREPSESASPTTPTPLPDTTLTPLPEFAVPPALQQTEFDLANAVPDGTTSDDGRVVKDINRWTLPTDPYVGIPLSTILQAQSAVVQRCLQQKGNTVTFPPLPSDANTEPRSVADDRLLFNESIAQRQGYGFGIDAPPVGASTMFEYMNLMAEYGDGSNMEEIMACQQTFWNKAPFAQRYVIPLDPGDVPFEQVIIDNPFIAQRHFEEITTPAIDTARDAWRACMQPRGIPDLPDYPELMPPPSVRQSWLGRDVDRSEEPPYQAEEIDLAVFDARCRDSSGYHRARYDTAWGLLQAHVTNHQPEMDRHYQRIQDEMATLQQLIDAK
ncbi:hypothetical protein [Stomatohabitans albus]|uniref:hypothetical protein n=1 Tax=Stomatohabitans albus TaxID=3110766 RepID=UPI00300DB247